MRKLGLKSTSELSETLGVSEKYLWRLSGEVDRHYRVWQVEKKNSTEKRTLTSPSKELRKIQKKIKELIFNGCDLGVHSHYGRKKRSNITNALAHYGQKNIYTCDLKSFFPSIRPERVKSSLVEEQGCSQQVATLITRLVTFDFQLPQGALTSTAIANIVTLKLQRRLKYLSSKFGLNFTILGDDLTFSGEHVFDGFVDTVHKIIADEGFTLHPTKGGKFSKCSSQIITGLNVGHGLTVGRQKRVWEKEYYLAGVKFEAGEITEKEYQKAKKRYKGRMMYSSSVSKLRGRYFQEYYLS